MAIAVTKVRKIGNSLGVTLPKQTIDRMHVAEGDQLFVVDTPDGLELTAYDPEFKAGMEAFEKVRRQYRNALRKLAE